MLTGQLSLSAVKRCLISASVARLKKLLFLGGLHSPCDNYSFLANVYCIRTKERRVLTGQLLLSAVKSC